MVFRAFVWLAAVFIALISVLGMALTREKVVVEPAASYATWSGSGPDKWASVWLIERYIAPGSVVSILPENTYPEDVILFDVPASDFMRDGQQTTFEKLLLDWSLQQATSQNKRDTFPSGVNALKPMQALQRFKTILHDVEVNTWQPNTLAVSTHVEEAFRTLQQDYHREAIPRACYLSLFDRLFTRLLQGDVEAITNASVIQPERQCAVERDAISEPLVQEVTPSTIGDYLRRGQSVVFVDVREPAEFNEIRIPGAQNIQIRHFNQPIADRLKQADLVVSYCVKDFRGYEMAAKIARAGIQHSAIMKPYGIKGWIDAGLSVYEGQGLEEDAIRLMQACLLHPASCGLSTKEAEVITL